MNENNIPDVFADIFKAFGMMTDGSRKPPVNNGEPV